MSNTWPTRKLRELADIRVSNVDKKVVASEKPVKLCNYMDVYSNEYVTGSLPFMEASASATELERFGLNKGDVIITKDSETPDDIGIPAVILDQIDNLVCGYHLALIRPNADQVDSIYLAKQLATSRVARFFALHASGSTRFGLSISTIESVEILTPPKPEQTKIAEILSTMDRAIEQTEALIAKQQRIKIGLMQDLLTRGIDEHGNRRSEQTHKFKDSSMGRIPVEWEALTLDDLAVHVGSGVTPRGGEAVYTKEGVLFIRSQNVHFGGLLLSDVSYLPQRIHDTMRRSEVFENDVLLNITGASIGRCCTMPKMNCSANVNQHVCAIRLNQATQSDAGFLTAVIESSIGQNQVLKFNAGGNREGLNYQQVRSFVIPWPKTEERQQSYALIKGAEEALEVSGCNLDKLRALKTALMQDLLSGKQRITRLLNNMEVGDYEAEQCL